MGLKTRQERPSFTASPSLVNFASMAISRAVLVGASGAEGAVKALSLGIFGVPPSCLKSLKASCEKAASDKTPIAANAMARRAAILIADIFDTD